MDNGTEFSPDWVSSPGETIADILEERKMPLASFAKRIGTSNEDARDLLSGEAALTVAIAKNLEKLFGASADFWMDREASYRAGIERLNAESSTEAAEVWARQLPTRDMTNFGWLPASKSSTSRARACLQFFGVSSVDSWRTSYKRVLENVAFRTSKTFDSNPAAVAAWLRQGEIEGSRGPSKPWDPKAFRETLHELRALTREKDPNVFLPELKRRCALCGVAVEVLRAPTGCRASGATWFLGSQKALILLSFRYLSDDHFWFSFFHEAGHLMLHGDVLFLETPEMVSSAEEQEANQFAEDILVPPKYRSEMLNLATDGRDVMRFARRIGISPGIVVGQLQHVGRLERRQLNNLKRRYKWGNSS